MTTAPSATEQPAPEPPARLHIPREQIAEFCRRNHIRRLALFGSVLRDDFGPESDVDVLVEFEPGAQVGLFALAEMQHELEELFARPVDLVLKNGLKRRIRNAVLAGARVIYAN
ncbi:MAG: nucleotidyltransferase family protein [Anaerolineales bacterium]|nr:nucleotidyltransferase family protein [Anaerolineales bacterium]MDW8326370.1 nucleotidyltransferase family protein [Anaerolineales bacterium]